jgi:hydroxyacylglutathione hydrolase
VEELRQKTGAKVVGAKADAHRLPVLDAAYDAMEIFDFSGHSVKVFDVSGHTLNHIAFYVADAQAAFTGDSLMAMGCGRLFEGSPAQMHQSLSQLASLPAETLICSGHEYTSSNAKFALTIEPNNPALLTRIADIKTARDNGIATVPSLLADELASNPFLRAHSAEIKTTLGLQDATEVEVFTQIRLRKDNF